MLGNEGVAHSIPTHLFEHSLGSGALSAAAAPSMESACGRRAYPIRRVGATITLTDYANKCVACVVWFYWVFAMRAEDAAVGVDDDCEHTHTLALALSICSRFSPSIHKYVSVFASVRADTRNLPAFTGIFAAHLL